MIQSSTDHQGQRNPRRGATPSTKAYFITTLPSNFLVSDHMVSPDVSRKTCVPAAMFTPPQLSDEEDGECIEESSNALYERQMLGKKQGFFFWLKEINLYILSWLCGD